MKDRHRLSRDVQMVEQTLNTAIELRRILGNGCVAELFRSRLNFREATCSAAATRMLPTEERDERDLFG